MLIVNPAHSFCGCFALLVGVEFVCLLDLVWSAFVVSVVSSTEPIVLNDFKIPPFWQVIAGAWALVGIPVIVGAGGAALYQVEANIRYYVKYKWGCFFIGVFLFAQLLMEGMMCWTATSSETQRLGSAMICGIIDSFAFFWAFLIGIIYIYTIHVVWSAAEEIAHTSELPLIHRQALRTAKEPPPPLPIENFSYAHPSAKTPLYAPTTTYVTVEAPNPAPVVQQTYTYTTVQEVQKPVRTASVDGRHAHPAIYAAYAPAHASATYVSAPTTYATQPGDTFPNLARPIRTLSGGSFAGVPSAAVSLDSPRSRHSQNR